MAPSRLLLILLLLQLQRESSSYECEHRDWALKTRTCFQKFPGKFSFEEGQSVCANYTTNFTRSRAGDLYVPSSVNLGSENFWSDVYFENMVAKSRSTNQTYRYPKPDYFIPPIPIQHCVASIRNASAFYTKITVEMRSCKDDTAVLCTTPFGPTNCNQSSEWTICHRNLNRSLDFETAEGTCKNSTAGGKIFRPSKPLLPLQDGAHVQVNTSYWINLGLCKKQPGDSLSSGKKALSWIDDRSPLKLTRLRSAGPCMIIKKHRGAKWSPNEEAWPAQSYLEIKPADEDLSADDVIQSDMDLVNFANSDNGRKVEICLNSNASTPYQLITCWGGSLNNLSIPVVIYFPFPVRGASNTPLSETTDSLNNTAASNSSDDISGSPYSSNASVTDAPMTDAPGDEGSSSDNSTSDLVTTAKPPTAGVPTRWSIQKVKKDLETDTNRWQLQSSKCQLNLTSVCLIKMTEDTPWANCRGHALVRSNAVLCFFLARDGDEVADRSSRYRARSLCQAAEADLPSFEDEEEMQFLASLFG